jgi:hypothetical protein
MNINSINSRTQHGMFGSHAEPWRPASSMQTCGVPGRTAAGTTRQPERDGGGLTFYMDKHLRGWGVRSVGASLALDFLLLVAQREVTS